MSTPAPESVRTEIELPVGESVSLYDAAGVLIARVKHKGKGGNGGSNVKLGITAPSEVSVVRSEKRK